MLFSEAGYALITTDEPLCPVWVQSNERWRRGFCGKGSGRALWRDWWIMRMSIKWAQDQEGIKKLRQKHLLLFD
jgi:hypothetical protein